MAQDKLTFDKGMMPQLDSMNQIPGSYIDAENIVRDELGNILNELGTTLIKELPTGYEVIGVKNFLGSIVIVSTNNTNSEFGLLNEDNSYSTIINSTVFGFNKSIRINMEVKVDFRGDRIVYAVGKGVKPRYINLDNPPTSNIDKTTSLFLDYDLPTVKFSDVVTGGKATTGVYQFAVRLVTNSNNKSPFSQLTGVIPIVDDSASGGRKSYDGAEPQTPTSKAIKIEVSNIDTTFTYIEPCVITYIGQSNQLVINSLSIIPINSKSTISFTYTGSEDHVDTIQPEELNLDSTSYNSAEYITQKDSTLILSSISEKQDTYNWQEVANSIQFKYYISEKKVDEDTVFINESGNVWSPSRDGDIWQDSGTNGTEYKDYKNPKMTESFKTWRRGEVYSFTFTPVFEGNRRGSTYHIPAIGNVNIEANTTTKYLGTAITQDFKYPASFGALSGTPVRYHRMPTCYQEPIISENIGESIPNRYIRLIGLEAEITIADKSWKDNVIGYYIGVENRRGKETIIAQGISKPTFTIDSTKKGTTPSFGNIKVTGVGDAVRIDDDRYDRQLFTYHSPDLIHKSITSFVPYKIERIMSCTATYKYANFGNAVGKSIKNFIDCGPGIPKNDIVNLYPNYVEIPTQSKGEDDRDGGESDFVVNLDLGKTEELRFKRILECVVMRTTNANLPRAFSIDESWEDNGAGDDEKYKSINNTFYYDTYNIHIESRNYYGDIYNKESNPVSIIKFKFGSKDPETGLVLNSTDRTRFFNGDTFISKYAIAFKDTMSAYKALAGQYDHVAFSSNIVYFHLESDNNYNYRHYNVEENATIPYYPKNKVIINNENTGLLQLPATLGHAVEYNKQYSAQNILQPTFTKAINEEQLTTFYNRSIYSATSVEGEKFDAYRLFLTNNYHDIPKQFGKITGSFVHAGELYFHTERATWRSFYNTLATQATSVGDIVLGNGGAFPRPSMPIMTLDGGYAGCKDISASIETPNGRYFIDTNICKIYRLGDGLQEISNPAIFNLLREKVYNKNCILGYDYGRKRLLLSSDNLTLSYNPELSGFTSRHSYKFSHSIYKDLTDILIQGGQIHKFDNTIVGRFFGNIQNSKLLIASVVDLGISKRYTNAEVILDSYIPTTKLSKPFEFIDRLKMYSKERNSGLCNFRVITDYTEDFETVGTIFVYKSNNKFRLSLPQDIVDDINQDIFNPENLKTHARFTHTDREFLPDMVDNHMVFEFTIDNNNQRIIKIQSLIINFDQNIT